MRRQATLTLNQRAPAAVYQTSLIYSALHLKTSEGVGLYFRFWH
jgi:hypothetical protein